jgi:hypothetical protein
VVVQGVFWALTLLTMCVVGPGASAAGAPLTGSLGPGVVAGWLVAAGALLRRTGWPAELLPAHWVRQYREGRKSGRN